MPSPLQGFPYVKFTNNFQANLTFRAMKFTSPWCLVVGWIFAHLEAKAGPVFSNWATLFSNISAQEIHNSSRHRIQIFHRRFIYIEIKSLEYSKTIHLNQSKKPCALHWSQLGTRTSRFFGFFGKSSMASAQVRHPPCERGGTEPMIWRRAQKKKTLTLIHKT